VRLIETGDDLRAHLNKLIAQLKSALHTKKWQLLPSDTAIQPLIVGGNHEVLALSEFLQAKGILVPAIRPPTVPQHTGRLRISLSAAHTEADVQQLVAAIHEAESQL
jgi:8-amino-7-oxononanoate synthase